MDLLFKGMNFSFKEKDLNNGWVRVFASYDFGFIPFFFWGIFFYGNADSFIVYARRQELPLGIVKKLGF